MIRRRQLKQVGMQTWCIDEQPSAEWGLLFAISAFRSDPGNIAMKFLTKFQSSLVYTLPGNGHVEIQMIAGRAAAEAAVYSLLHVHGE